MEAANDFVILKEVTAEKSAGGIILAGTGTEKLKLGKVYSVGPDVQEWGGIEVGSTVLYSIFAAEEFSEDGQKYLVTRSKEIRGIEL